MFPEKSQAFPLVNLSQTLPQDLGCDLSRAPPFPETVGPMASNAFSVSLSTSSPHSLDDFHGRKREVKIKYTLGPTSASEEIALTQLSKLGKDQFPQAPTNSRSSSISFSGDSAHWSQSAQA